MAGVAESHRHLGLAAEEAIGILCLLEIGFDFVFLGVAVRWFHMHTLLKNIPGTKGICLLSESQESCQGRLVNYNNNTTDILVYHNENTLFLSKLVEKGCIQKG